MVGRIPAARLINIAIIAIGQHRNDRNGKYNVMRILRARSDHPLTHLNFHQIKP